MAEETTTTTVDEQDVQATAPDGDVDYEALYHKEKKYSQSMRSRAQDAEGERDKLTIKTEEVRQTKMIAEGKQNEVIQEQTATIKEQAKIIAKFDKRDADSKSNLLEKIYETIPEDDRVIYENMDIKQLEHFVNQLESPGVSNPAEAVQGRTNANYNLDSFMGENDKYKRENFGDIVKNYERKASNKIKVN
tara:strand:- start:181 stop:753 length:573 start_codon:yes stop_codon:yes gene_type:complete